MRELKDNFKKLQLFNLQENIEEYVKDAETKNLSRLRFLKQITKLEIDYKQERKKLSRLSNAKIPIKYVMETFPFNKQPQLNKKRLLERYDSIDYISQKKNLVFIGPTGCGKTGLGTSFLTHAINNDYTGRFIVFSDLMDELHKSQADNSGKKVVLKYSKFDCLLIDELGYLEVNKAQIGLFFNLMQLRHKKTCTIITSNLGFKEWNDFLQNPHLTAALVDRLTDSGHVINMKKCESLRSGPEID